MTSVTKTLTLLFFVCSSFNTYGQDNPTERAQPIVVEGKLLYRSEMASWYGTDLFLAAYKDQSKIGGYFSYVENDMTKCIFFSTSEKPRVIGTVVFDNTYDINNTKPDLSEREFTRNEYDLYSIREAAMAVINSDTLFKRYTNTNFNLIPIISEGQKKVYVLTGPKKSGVVIMGNDYLITFDKDNKITSKRQLHRNIIPIGYESQDEETEGAMHSHLPETGEFITATDICTLMLYAKFKKWKQHSVVSARYLNIWNCNTNELTVIPMETIKKIEEDQKKRNKKD